MSEYISLETLEQLLMEEQHTEESESAWNLIKNHIHADNIGTIDMNRELELERRSATNNIIEELRTMIPIALWDKTAEELSADQCYSFWQYCLECVREMKDAWEEANGENLVWVPGHYEEVKDG